MHCPNSNEIIKTLFTKISLILYKLTTMRKSILTIIVVAITLHTSAQKIQIGPEVGINLINVEKQEIGDNFQPGIFGGAALDYKIFDNFSIRTGVYYSQSRHAYSSADTNQLALLDGIIDSSLSIPGIDLNTYTSIEGRRSHSYLQIPIQANFSFNEIQLFVGGYMGFMIAGTQKQTTTERSPILENINLEDLGIDDPTGFLSAFLPKPYSETYLETKGTDNFRLFDYGLKLGLGYQMKQFGVQAMYSFGLADYRSETNTEEFRGNRFFQFSVRYMLPIGAKASQSSIR